MGLTYAVYAGHAPQLIVERQGFTAKKLQELGKKVQQFKPDAIVSCSSLFVGDGGFYVDASQKLQCRHDSQGFPPEYYKARYDCSGLPELGSAILREAKALKIKTAETDEWGLDHSQWIPLTYLAPKKDVPVVSVSISNASLEGHLNWGRAIRNAIEKSRKNVVFVASGSLTHRADLIVPGPARAFPESDVFDSAVQRAVESGNHEKLFKWDKSLWDTVKPEGNLGAMLTTVGVVGKDFHGRQVWREKFNTGITISTFEFTKA